VRHYATRDRRRDNSPKVATKQGSLTVFLEHFVKGVDLKTESDAAIPLKNGRTSLIPLEHCIRNHALERNHAVYAIGTEDAEFTFVITAEVDQATATLAGAG
jgi:hypothetical protein